MPLKILLVDTDAGRAKALDEQLSASGYAEVLRAPDGADLVATVEDVRPDLIIIDMALPDRDALEEIRMVSTTRPIVMFGGSDDLAFVEEAIAAGVSSYNLSGVALRDVKLIMASAIALFKRHQSVESELAATKALLDERRLIERAKAILMRDQKMTEPEAYRWLRRKAMNENRKLAQVAAELVEREDSDARRA